MRYLAAVLLLSFVPLAQAGPCHKAKPWTWFKQCRSDAEWQAYGLERQHDRWYKDKSFWIGTAIIAASIAADAHSTVEACPGCRETNGFLGTHPSNGDAAFVAGGGFALVFGLHIANWELTHRDPQKPWRVEGRWLAPALAVAVEGRSAINNYRLDGKF
jgi:hypothetical protein